MKYLLYKVSKKPFVKMVLYQNYRKDCLRCYIILYNYLQKVNLLDKMGLIMYLFFLIYLLIYHAQSFNIFCYSLCTIRSCTNYTYNSCTGCTTGFMKDPNNTAGTGGSPAPCITQTYDKLSTGAKYIPIAVTNDIKYDLMSATTIATLQTTSTAVNTTYTCAKDSNNNYTFYGDLYNTDTLTISHTTGISDPSVHFWKVRITGAILTVDNWSTTSALVVNFPTNSTEPPLAVPLGSSPSIMDSNFKVCDKSNQDQYYKTFSGQFLYNDTMPLEFVLSVQNNTQVNPWGIMQFVVQVRLCHAWCLSCFGDGTNTCYSCDNVYYQTMLSNTTCALTCQIGYGYDSASPDTCILCQDNCSSCQNINTNCTLCLSGFYLLNNNVTVDCVAECPVHYYLNTTGVDECFICDSNCQNCTTNSTKCTSCYSGFYLYNWACYNPCPSQTYGDTNTSTCISCNNTCFVCTGSSTNCSVCDINGTYISYLLNNSCVTNCGPGYYEDNNGTSGPNLCVSCLTQCATCDFNSSHCLSCDPGFYLLNNSCGLTCPAPDYFADDVTWSCLDCSMACVDMNMNLYFKNNIKQDLVCDLQFQQALNWTSTDIQNFVSIQVVDPLISINNFNIVYQVVSPTVMRITLTPKGYIFIYNVTFTFTTMSYNGTNHKASNGYPFKNTNYAVSKSISWFLIKAPSLSDMEKNIIDSVSKFSDQVINFTTLPFVQQIKKAGIFTMLLGGAQATSTSCLVNTIPAQNFYQGVRLWASFVFFDVPPWEQNSQKSKLIIAPPASEVIKGARLLQDGQQQLRRRSLFDTSKLEWRFQRTGHTSFFIFDTYMNIFLMSLCWILVIIANKCIKDKFNNKRFVSMFYTFLHKVHQISIFYISLSTLLEWIYFDAASAQRWISFILCIVFNAYFLIYELYIYYDMINYPLAEVGNKKYQYYCMRYGSLLRNVRFIEYDKTQKWTVKHWFRPYNYHILSYYKKFLMMIALPIFYQTLYMQTYCLLIIQLFQIVRFIMVWPFKSKVRNFVRLGLQLVLFTFFGSIVIQTMMVKEIMLSDPNTLQSSVDLFYKIGWVGFCMVFVFNIGHLVIFIIDITTGCRKSNIQLMDESRRFYYMQKLSTYEDQNQDVPLELVNKWVKLGNLNNRRYQQLPDINLRIQLFKILKKQNSYQIEMKKIVEIFMNIDFNYQKQNNIAAGKKITKRFTLNKTLSSTFFYLIDDLYKKYTSSIDFQYMTIKTFLRIPQSDFKPGDKIQQKMQAMSQKIELQSIARQNKIIKLQSILSGFPIPYQSLKQFV